MTDVTRFLKRKLWERFGAPEHPAEWDGRTHGGGKLSQRYWEYFQAVEYLELTRDSVVLDIGGGSPFTGTGFLADLLALAAKRVIILDPELNASAPLPANVVGVRKLADETSLAELLRNEPGITHVSCVSVLEHVPPDVRVGMMRALNAHFTGERIVVTFEYHARSVHFDDQLTAKSTSELFMPLTKFYPDAFTASPVWAENAFDMERLVRVRRGVRMGRAEIPLWYPVAVRFVRADDDHA